MKRIAIALAAAFLLVLSCEIDKGLAPITSGIRGTIAFRGAWPANTEQVLVVASTDFPPQGISQLDMGEPLPMGVDSAQYTIYLPPGLYRAVAIVWKEKGYEWNVNNIIGVYFAGKDSLSPGQVEVPKGTVVQGVNMTADFRRARPHFESSINGTLHIHGAWPARAQNLFVVASLSPLAFPKLPSLLDLYISGSLPIGGDSVGYSISAPPDTYWFLAAILLEEGAPIGLTSIKGLRFGPVVVPDNKARVEGLDIDVFLSGSP
ncbi:MAG: hypothetical protein QHJ34_10005 [bacterium]|jgi:hypothetical protein|nr:hypothetical protein [candidate division KSB1 bacterium]MDH7560550.1 hypothetical protein [bacterium]